MTSLTDQTLVTIEPHVRLRPNHERSLSLVDAKLRDIFVRLVKGQAKWPLLIYGPAGTGKTSAALALCDHAVSATLLDVDSLCDKIMDRDREYDLWEWIGGKALAVLDELGARERVGELHYGAVKHFADARQGRPAIFISNLEPKDLLRVYDDRVYSRITSGTCFRLDGQDRRRA